MALLLRLWILQICLNFRVGTWSPVTLMGFIFLNLPSHRFSTPWFSFKLVLPNISHLYVVMVSEVLELRSNLRSQLHEPLYSPSQWSFPCIPFFFGRIFLTQGEKKVFQPHTRGVLEGRGVYTSSPGPQPISYCFNSNKGYGLMAKIYNRSMWRRGVQMQ